MEKEKKKKNKKVIVFFRDGKTIKADIKDADDVNNEIRLIAEKAGYRFPRDVQDFIVS